LLFVDYLVGFAVGDDDVVIRQYASPIVEKRQKHRCGLA